MKNPKDLEIVIPAAAYKLPTYVVTNEGIKDGNGADLFFCKGNKQDENVLRQEGVFTETLLAAAKNYLETVNVGPMATEETTQVIEKLGECLELIDKRARDRQARNVQGTYQK